MIGLGCSVFRLLLVCYLLLHFGDGRDGKGRRRADLENGAGVGGGDIVSFL